MNTMPPSTERLLAENEELRRRLEEAEEIIAAIRGGGVDAFVMKGAEGERVYTLQMADSLYRSMVKQMQQGAATLSADGIILFANPRLSDLLQVPHHQLINTPLESYVRPEERPMWRALLAMAFTEPGSQEGYLRRVDGADVPVYLAVSPIASEENALVCLIVTDLTRERVSEGLRTSEQILQAAGEEIFQLMLQEVKDYSIILLDAQGRTTSWSKGAERITGYMAEEILGQHIRRFYTEEAAGNGFPELGLEVAKAEGRFEDEGWRVRKDGTQFWASVVITPVRDQSGELRGFSKITRDLTERHRREEELLLLNAAVSAAANSIVITNADGTIVWVNTAFTILTGYSQEEAVGRNPRILKSGEQSAETYGHLWQTIKAGHVWQGTLWNRRKDGSKYIEEMTITPLRNRQGEISRFIAIKQDVTEKKQLEERQLRLLAIIEATPDLVAMADDNFRVTFLNRAGRQLLGLGKEEDLTHTYIKEYHPKEAGKVVLEEGIPAALRTGTWQGETTLLSRDGKEMPVSQVILAHKTASGELQYLSTVMRDLTDRKEYEALRAVEQALRASEERLRRAIVDSPIPALMYAEDGEVLHVSRCWTEITGYAPEELPTYMAWTERAYGPGRNEEVNRLIRRLFDLEQRKDEGEFVIRTRLGEERIWDFSSSPLGRLPDGRRTVISMAKDVTDRKRAEDALRKSEALLLHAQRCAGAGVWDIDLIANSASWSEPYYELYGLPRTVQPSHESWIASIYPEDRERVDAEFAQAVAGRGVQRIEFRIVRNGQVRWLHSEGRVICNHEGRPERVTGITWDITGLKRAEVARRESEERFRNVFDYAATGMALLDLEGRFLKVNRALCEIVGYSEDELLSVTFQTITHSDDLDSDLTLARQLYAGEITHYHLEKRYLHKLGHTIWIKLSGSLVRDAQGKALHTIALIEDITRRKQAEEQVTLDLAAMTRLQALGTRFVQKGNLEPVLSEVVDVAIAIAGADFGNIQLLDPATGDLCIAAQRGFPQWWIDFWTKVSPSHGVCGTALKHGVRVIVEDVEHSPIFAGTPELAVQLRAGVRAVQSTPLVTRTGKPVGMFSTHYKTPHRPDARALRLLDLLARQAADFIESAQAEEALRTSEAEFRSLAESMPQIVWATRPDG